MATPEALSCLASAMADGFLYGLTDPPSHPDGHRLSAHMTSGTSTTSPLSSFSHFYFWSFSCSLIYHHCLRQSLLCLIGLALEVQPDPGPVTVAVYPCDSGTSCPRRVQMVLDASPATWFCLFLLPSFVLHVYLCWPWISSWCERPQPSLLLEGSTCSCGSVGSLLIRLHQHPVLFRVREGL